MIFVVEQPSAADPRAWFAFDEEDLLRKVAAIDLELLRSTQARIDSNEPGDLAVAALKAIGDCRVYRTEAEATAAFERAEDPTWQGEGWRSIPKARPFAYSPMKWSVTRRVCGCVRCSHR